MLNVVRVWILLSTWLVAAKKGQGPRTIGMLKIESRNAGS